MRVWDARAPTAPAAAFLPAAGSPARDAWCVALGDAHGPGGACVLAGYDNGDLKMFELRSGGGAAVRWEARLDKGVCGVQVSACATADVRLGGWTAVQALAWHTLLLLM